MSRYTIQITKEKDIAYGYDEVTGYFFQVFNGLDENGFETLEVDECTFLTKMTKGRMIDLMEQFQLPVNHIMLVALDLPF